MRGITMTQPHQTALLCTHERACVANLTSISDPRHSLSVLTNQLLSTSWYTTASLPMVGIVVTISPNFSLYRMVVFPAASRPTGEWNNEGPEEIDFFHFYSN